MNYTVPLETAARPSHRRVGGKAEGLGELVDRGFRVPEGFCVTVGAFHRAVEECLDEVSSIEELREELERYRVPDRLRAEIASRVESIGASRWAVRSSSVEEDREEFSFAGQEHTELDVEGVDGICEALVRVWAGLFDAAGLAYRSRIRVDLVPGGMGVVVQEMVEAELAGVAFTRDPFAADDSTEILVSAARDDPREVVEGRGGEHYRIDRSTGRPVGDWDGSILEASRMAELADRLRELERAVGGARDVEWAWGRPSGDPESTESKLYFLQSRPITGRRADDEESVWTNANVGEALPGVATPLTWSIIGRFSRRGFERAFGTLGLSVPEDYELVGSFRGRVYLNLSQFVSVAGGIPILEPDVLFEMAGGGGLELVRDSASRGSVLEFLGRLPLTALRVVVSQLAMPLFSPVWSRYFERRLQAFFDRDRSDWSRGELAAEWDRVDWLFDRTGLVMLTCSSNFLMSYVVFKKFLDWFGGPGAERKERELFEALEVRSAEPVLDMLELADAARRLSGIAELLRTTDPAEAREALRRRARRGDVQADEFLEEFERFRRAHGHRAPREAELSTPRWREEDRFIFEMLRVYLEADDLPSAEDYRRRWAEERRELEETVGELFGPVGGELFRWILKWARGTARIREFMRLHVVQSLDMYRDLVRTVGRSMVRSDLLQKPDDVFYLRHSEIRDWLDGSLRRDETSASYRLRVMIRRAMVDRLRELPDPPNTFVLSDGEIVAEEEYRRREEPPETSDDGGTILEGLAGSPGRATGIARVIRDPEGAEPLRAGEILVAPQTDVGWTPMFLAASAVVVGLGGPLSHACIVAREFGVPTVVNAQGAADVIETGDRITVNGDDGIVIVHRGDSDDEGAIRDRDEPSRGGSVGRSSNDQVGY